MFGERLRLAGTLGWPTRFYTSELEHDQIVMDWLAEEIKGQNMGQECV